MEFTDGLFRHLFHTGCVPSLLILDFQLSLYLCLWTKTCKTVHQNQNCKPFQTILKISTVLLDGLLQQTLRWQSQILDHPQETLISPLTFPKNHMESLMFSPPAPILLPCLRQPLSIMFPAFRRQKID